VVGVTSGKRFVAQLDNLGTTRIYSIQAMRGIAAIMVAMGHLSHRSVPISGSDPTFEAIRITTKGLTHAGVDIFFVISGAIMFMITHRARYSTRLAESAAFLIRRVFRIYILFWITLAVSVLLDPRGMPTNGLDILRSVALIDMQHSHLAAWTLVFEIRFYLVVAVLLLLFRNTLGRGFLIWAALVCVGVTGSSVIEGYGLLAIKDGPLPKNWFYHPLMLEFVMGVAVGALVTHRIHLAPLMWTFLGIAGIVFGCFLVSSADLVVGRIRVWAFGVPAAMLIYGLVTLEQARRLRVPLGLILIGEASYSLYLWHNPIYTITERWWADFNMVSGIGFTLLSILLVALVTAASYGFMEKRFMGATRIFESKLLGRYALPGTQLSSGSQAPEK